MPIYSRTNLLESIAHPVTVKVVVPLIDAPFAGALSTGAHPGVGVGLGVAVEVGVGVGVGADGVNSTIIG